MTIVLTNCLGILLVSVSFYVFSRSLVVLYRVIADVYSSGLFRKSSEEVGVEIPDAEPVKPKYDVLAFKQRIERMKDEDGLYDVPSTPPKTDFTGTEIITENFEIEMDRLIGRD